MSTSDGDFYPGSTTQRRSAGGKGPALPDSVTATWERYGQNCRMGNRVVRLYTISALAEALGRSVITIRHWHENKVLPEPELRTDGRTHHARRRMYTHEQIVGLVQIAESEGLLAGKRKFLQHTAFSERAHALFTELQHKETDA